MSLDESLLFFGRTNTVTLTPSPATATLCTASGWDFVDARETSSPAPFPWSLPGTLLASTHTAHAGNLIVFPQVPATLPVARQGLFDAEKISLPSCLQQPVQKATSTQLGDAHNVVVYTSGARSAICKEGSALFRLKGCGMGIDNSGILDAFPTRHVGEELLNPLVDLNSPPEPEVLLKPIEIRGAMFDFTVQREQALTSKVNTMLQRAGIPQANIPLGYYKYADWKVKTADESEKTCSLCCGLYSTFGDKRLASHLLWGLELLIPLIFADPTEVEDDLRVSQDETVLAPSSSWIELAFPKERISEKEVIDTGFAALEGAEPLLNFETVSIDPTFVNSRICPPEMPAGSDIIAWNHLWLKEWQPKTSGDSCEFARALSSLYWSLGWQAGTILRCIHDANINWGTYEDLLGNHCNSHPNNLIVLQAPQNGFLLAPLDFDLAFTRETYCTKKQEQSTSDIDDSWNELKAMETQGMLLALGGLNLNSGVEGKAEIPKSYEPIRIALRDTIVKAFDAAYHKKMEHKEVAPEMANLHQSLVRLALILSEKVVA